MPATPARPSIADCEANQAAWFRAQAEVTGGAIWRETDLEWVAPGPTGDCYLLFPRTITPSALDAGISKARALGYDSIGAWLSPEVDARPLAAAGFEEGWSPWWMVGRLDHAALVAATNAAADDPHVGLVRSVREYDGSGDRLLTLTRGDRPRAWHAVARVDGTLVGRAWAFSDGMTAGIYDMDVAPGHRRQGLGGALLAAVSDAARQDGHSWAVLNATPDGERPYRRFGLARIGDGITWWLHGPELGGTGTPG